MDAIARPMLGMEVGGEAYSLAAARCHRRNGSSFVLFFSASDGRKRACVVHAVAATFDDAWRQGCEKLSWALNAGHRIARWVRVDWVEQTTASNWRQLRLLLASTKRNYFRFGLALDSGYRRVFLEQELNANAMLYGGNATAHAVVNDGNFQLYADSRFPGCGKIDFSDDAAVSVLHTGGLFRDEDGSVYLLGSSGRDAGRRIVEQLSADDVLSLIHNSSSYLAGEVNKDGTFVYGYHPCFDRRIDTYNTLRHSSTTYSMIEAWEVTRDDRLKAAIDRSLAHIGEKLVQLRRLPDGSQAAFLVDVDGEIKLGGNAVTILALTKYSAVTGTDTWLPLAGKLAEGILFMQDQSDGSFVHVLNGEDLSTKDRFRTIYYEGEAAFGLMRLYGLTGDPRWLEAVERAFGHFIACRHWEHNDHWLSYCVNELTRYRPEERYFRFGIDNFAPHLDFVIERITTFPTLLELMMAAEEMITRLQSLPGYSHLLEGIDMQKFHRALHIRAHYLLNGHFWPEIAMFFRNPARIAGSFFIRHHGFRVRIDDVEHYLSGLIAYRRLLLRGSTPDFARDQPRLTVAPHTPADPETLGFLMYPESPRGFTEVTTLARKAAAKGMRVYYASYRNAHIEHGKLNGYAFAYGRWTKAEFDIPAIIDNAPPRRKAEEELFNRLSQGSFLTCHKLGGKQKTLDLLAADRRSSDWVIPSAPLTAENLSALLQSHGKAVVKPYRSSRGRGVFVFEKRADGRLTVSSNEGADVLDAEALGQFLAMRPASRWMVQKYVASSVPEGNAFDIRVPLICTGGNSWKPARTYARLGSGSVTSNLATGGSSYDAAPFLAQIYGEEVAGELVAEMERAALAMAEVLQDHFPFTIDALGCDFGVADGRIWLFEVNAYPGMKGCLESATDLKAAYFAALAASWKNAGTAPVPNGMAQPTAAGLTPPSVKTSRPDGRTQAATPQNRALLEKAIAAGRTEFSPLSRLSRTKSNFAAALIAEEANRRGYCVRAVSKTHIELSDSHGLIAVFSPSAPNLSFPLAKAVANKSIVRRMLTAAGLCAPAGDAFAKRESAQSFFRSRESAQVVKPILGSGRTTIVSPGDEKQFLSAWDIAKRRGRRVVVEDLAAGDRLLLVVIAGEVAAAIFRLGPTSSEKTVNLLEVLHPSFLELGRKAFDAFPGATLLGIQLVAKDFGADAFSANATIVGVDCNPPVEKVCFPDFGPPAEAIAGRLIDAAEQTRILPAARIEDQARIEPAAILAPACGGSSYPRSYRLQSRILRDAAGERNIRIEALSEDVTALSRNGRRLLFCFGIPDTTLVAARRASNDKEWTKRLLASAGIEAPRGSLFAIGDYDAAWRYARKLGLPVVTKPVTGSGGDGVSTDIASENDFRIGWDFAAATGTTRIIVEECIIGYDYRLVVIGNRLVAGCRRMPAYVTGNGVDTILELIEKKNVHRECNPHHGGKPIVLTDLMQRNLRRRGLNEGSVIEDGRVLELHTVANLGRGGEAVDETDRMHPGWAEIAVRARRAIYNACHAGLDIIAEDIARAPDDQRWSVIEVNTNPDFGANHFPMHGHGRDVAGPLLDELFRCP